MKKFISIALLLVLSGCNLPAQKRGIKIVYIGDSITAGVWMDDAAVQAPPAKASTYLQQQPDMGSVAFSNQGHSGYTTVDFLPGTATFSAVEDAAKTLQGEPGLLLFSIMLGTNDSAIAGPNGSPIAPGVYYTNLKSIIDKLLYDFPQCKVIINLPLWYSPNTYNGARYLQDGLNRLQSYFPRIKTLVKSYGGKHVFLGDTAAFNYFKTNYLTKLRPEDGHQGTFYLHPTSGGAADLGVFWGKAIYGVVEGK